MFNPAVLTYRIVKTMSLSTDLGIVRQAQRSLELVCLAVRINYCVVVRAGPSLNQHFGDN